MNTSFALAPRSRRYDWDKAAAFALAPAAPTFAAIYFFTGGLLLATIVTLVCIIGTSCYALTLSSTPVGRLALTADELLIESGFFHARIPLSELNLADAHAGAAAHPGFRLSTRRENAVTIPRKNGPALEVTPLDRDAFLESLHSMVK